MTYDDYKLSTPPTFLEEQPEKDFIEFSESDIDLLGIDFINWLMEMGHDRTYLS